MHTIRVLVVEDSYVFREVLVRALSKVEGIEVVATARDAYQARDAILEYKPDVMTLDLELPKMSGLEFLEKLIPQYPLPVVVISSLNDKVFDAMKAGAVDFVVKPFEQSREAIHAFAMKELPEKIVIASTAYVGSRKRVEKEKKEVTSIPQKIPHTLGKDFVVALGASTGGTEATAHVLKELPENMPGMVIVQHMPKGFTEMYANRLNQQSRLQVKEAKTGDLVLPGTVLIAPGGDAHMELVNMNGTFQVRIKKAPKVNGHCPSVDVLFHSEANQAKNQALGIILTGMGGDGAKGLLEMRQAGAHTIGQDASTCVVYGMPKVAFDLGAVEYQEKLQNIAKRTCQILQL